MKKFLLALTTVAVVTGCNNDEVYIDEQAPQPEATVETPIAFSIFADKATRAQATDLEAYHNTFAVYGTKENNGMQTVFSNVTVTYQQGVEAPNEWTYSPLRYWDKQGSYEFIAFTPAAAPINYTLANDGKISGGKFATTGKYTLIGQNIQNGTSEEEKYVGFVGGTGKDTDIMLSDKATADGALKPIVNLNFRHILAKLNVALKTTSTFPSVITVKNITITGLDDTGEYTDAAGWTSSSVDANYKLQYDDATGVVLTDKVAYFIESLIMPQAMDGKLTLVYEITSGGYTETYTYVIDLDDVFASITEYEIGANYTITFTVNPSDAIMFDADVAPWDEETNSNQEIK